MKIHYLATANIPSKSANSLQITKMCDAFSDLGYDVNLFIPNMNNVKISISNYYDLKNKFKITKSWEKN